MRINGVNMIKNLWERFVIWGYVRTGLQMGDASSYGFMGKNYGPDYKKKHQKWLNWYKKLGYIPIPNHIWQGAGGYGDPYEHLLKISN